MKPKANAQIDRLTGQVEILLPQAVPHGFDYAIPAGLDLAPGAFVSVPFGKKEALGVAWQKGTASIAAGKMKPVIRAHEEFPPLSDGMRQFVDWAAWYNCASRGAVLKMVMPIAGIDKAGRKEVPIAPVDLRNVHLAKLSEAQKKAADALREKIGHGFSATILDGVTGSGKTEVYFQEIAETLKRDGKGQVLIMLPEIALSVQWLERFEKRFGFKPPVWNSEITPATKRAVWRAIAKGEARVIIGARSALFLPYPSLSLIVVDEEHDTSYKQEEGVIYHARDMAVARARFEKIPVILVSATPSLETYHNVQQGKYKEVSLPTRHNAAQLPDIEMLDMREVPLERGAFISEPLRKQLAEVMAAGHQSLLFLNRRGYAPLILCRTCGYRFQCPECSSWLVMHRSRPRLECHHCGFSLAVPDTCPECKKEGNLHACGPGVERVLEEVKEFLPQARIAVMASDQIENYREIEKTIADMVEGRIDLLIGTQMIAKGHHFAGLALVGVVDADLGLSGGDPRASERTYQLLHQLSGRAGREQVKGTVYLQSFLPDHPVMQALLSGDRNAFLAAELEARRQADMPPFSRLAAVIVEGTKEDQVMKSARELAAKAHAPKEIHILGPAPAPLYRLRGKFRYRLLIKASRNVNLPDFMRGWIESVKLPASVRARIDIDPVSFL